MNHTGTNEAQVDLLLRTVVGNRTNGVVGIPLGDIRIVDVRVGNHRLVDLIEVDDDFREILGIGIGSQRRLFTGSDFRNPLVGNVDQTAQHLRVVFHALVDHDLDTALGDLERLDQDLVF